MQQLQSLKRLLFFYVLTLLIMLSVYYIVLFLELETHSQQHSFNTFNSLQHEFTDHTNPSNSEIEKILDKPFFQDISYQLVFVLPSGQTYIHRHTRPDEREFTTITFPRITSAFENNSNNSDDNSTNNSAYTLNNTTLTGVIKLDSGHQIYIVLRHQPLTINWISYRFWLPFMTAIILFIIALLYMLNRQSNWEKLLLYTDSLSAAAKEAYSPLPFSETTTTPEFSHLGHTLSRISYQLHNNHRRIKTLSHRLERLVDQAPLPMMMIMRHGQVSFFNQRFEHLFATSFQSNVDYQLSDFVTGNDETTQLLLQKLATLRVTRTLLVYGIENKQAYQLHITPWFGEHGQVHGFTALLNNVNEFVNQTSDLQLQNQQLQQQLNDFRQLRSVISHELRPPLNDIIGILERIDPKTLSTQQHEVMTTLTQSSHSMLAMLNDTLDMVKKEVGETHIISEPVDIFELGQHVSHLMTDDTRRHGLEMLYFFAPDCPRYIDTDGRRLHQILVNLLDNAIKLTTSGYVALLIEPVNESITIQHIPRSQMTDIITAEQITIKDIKAENTPIKTSIRYDQESASKLSLRHNSSQQHNWIRLSVETSDIDITEAEQQLFSYFNQENPEVSQRSSGLGLDLAISNSFAQLLGGFIQLDREPEHGNAFNLYLPCRQPNYQPVYHFHSSLTDIHLIAVINQTVRASYLQRFCDYLSLSVSMYSHLDQTTITQISAQLKQGSKERATVLLLDYEYYLSEISALVETPITDSEPAIDKENNNNMNAKHTFDEIVNNKSLPKILYSMKTERNIPSTLLDKFDGFLTKPLNLGLLLSELIRLTKQPIAQLPSDKKVNNEPTAALNNDIDETVAPLILVVEDSITNQKITCKLLSKLGYRSVIAEDGQQALDLLKVQRQEITLILMDCRMPVMDGLQATQAIRAQGDDIIIVALTANNTEEDREVCIAVGMDEFLSKPVNKEKLEAVLKKFIKA